ncbi:MAG: sugar transferase [Lewinellaceae bacterium]|jgi:lipopolysaccharide/colanic/teichoic acid biosynthesis glycosyltransferase|nr:sugar transferase [Lewinellaceae bacterium]
MGQLQHGLMYENAPKQTFPNLYRRALGAEIPAEAVKFIEEWVDLDDLWDSVILNTSSPLNLINVISWRGYDGSEIGSIINIKRLNDIRYVNKFLESANEYLRPGGYLIGCVETSQQRKDRLMEKFAFPFNHVYYFFDFWVKRVWPKMPHLKHLYFLLTLGRNRVISEMETYGRLYSCGYKLLKTVDAGGQMFFVAQKIAEPDYNSDASYGPLIKLRRVGKNGKIFNVYKLRTMYPYSEYLQAFIYDNYGLQKGGKFKDDPRVTTMGRIFRKYWIDELPMLINWLKGDVKLMGVRPLSKHYFGLYPKEFQDYRKQFKPGLIPPVYVEIPKSLEDVVDIECRYLKAYERNPILTDMRYFWKAFCNIVFKKVRSN